MLLKMYFIKDDETLQSLIAFPLYSGQWTIKRTGRPMSHGMIQSYVNIHRITQNFTESQNDKITKRLSLEGRLPGPTLMFA